MYKGNNDYIFISYAHNDAQTVLPIIDGLTKNGFRLWYDNGIEAGTEWPEYIAEMIMKCNVVVAFLSKSFIASHNCRREINFAIETKKELLVVYLEDLELSPGMRLQLNSLQAIFRSRSKDLDSFIDVFLRAAILQDCRETIVVESAVEEKTTAGNKSDMYIQGMNVDKEQTEQENRIPESFSDPVDIKRDEKSVVMKALIQCQREYSGKDNDLYSILFKDQLKPKQIKKAIETFADGVKSEDILAMIDESIFDSGKEGFLFTDSMMYFSVLKKNGSVNIRNVQSVSLQENKTTIVVNFYNGEVMHVFIGTACGERICTILNLIAEKLREAFPAEHKVNYVALAVRAVNENEEKAGNRERFKFRCELTDRQITNALKKFAHNVNVDDIVAMADLTLSDSGKEGFLITKTGMYDSSKDRMNVILFNDIRSVEIAENNRVVFEFENGMIRKYSYYSYTVHIYNLFDELIKQRRKLSEC